MANNVVKRIWNRNKMVNIEALDGMTFQGEGGGHTFYVSCINDTGATVALSGTVSGVFRRADNADIALIGSIRDGAAAVTLTTPCYAVPGKFGLTIFVTDESGYKTAVYAAIGTVASTSGGAVAGSTPQSVVDLINAIAAATATIPSSYTDLMAAVAPTYSNTAVYAVGSYVWYAGVLYRCKKAITTAETWNANKWVAVSVGQDLGRLYEACGNNRMPLMYNFTNGKYISSTDGTEVESESWSSTDYIDVSGKSNLFVYSTFASNYNKFYDSSHNAIAGTVSVANGFTTLTIPSGAVYFRASLRTDYISGFSLFTQSTDNTLTQGGVPADAGSVASLKAVNSYVVFEYTGNYAQTTSPSGIVFSFTNGVGTFSGTSTNSSFRTNIFYGGTIPTWLKAGVEYGVDIVKTGTGPITLRVATYDANNKQNVVFDSDKSGVFMIPSLLGVSSVYIYYYTEKGNTVNCTMKTKILSAPSNKFLGERSFSGRFRIMQNNIGCFRYGRSPGVYEHTSAQALQKLTNYKRFFGEYKPDILCLQEYVKYIGDGTYESINLFNGLYRNITADTDTAGKQPIICTNLDASYRTGVTNLKDENGTTTLLRYAEVFLLTYNVRVLSFALTPTTTTSGSMVDNRAVQWAALMDLMDAYPNVILCADLNVDSETELTNLLDVSVSHGFNLARMNSGYWGYSDTYMNPPNNNNSYYRRIDNIITKGRVKMINSQCLFHETTDFTDAYSLEPTAGKITIQADLTNPDTGAPFNHLASDHIPVMVDVFVF